MKRKTCIIILLIIIASLSFSGCSGDGNVFTKKQKIDDFNYAYKIIKENHPYLEVNKRKTDYDWLSHKKEFEKQIGKTKNDIEFYLKMSEIITLIQNAHTKIISPEEYDFYKKCYEQSPTWSGVIGNQKVSDRYYYWKNIFNDEMYVIPIIFTYVEGKYVALNYDNFKCESYGIPLGSILKKIDSTDIDEYIKDLNGKDYLTYDYIRKKLYKYPLMFMDYGNKPEKTFTVETQDGKTIEKTIEYRKLSEYLPLENTSQNENVHTKILVKNTAAYVKINSMNMMTMKDDDKIILDFLKNVHDYPYLIIDIRGNGGGGDNYWMYNLVGHLINSYTPRTNYLAFRNGEYIKPFIDEKLFFSNKPREIKYLPPNKNYPQELFKDFDKFIETTYEVPPSNTVGFKGKILLLVDGCVYSSSESFAAFAKSTKWATLIGTTTGGDGIGYDPVIFSLPNSGLLIRFPCVMGLNPDGSANEETHTKPDIVIEQSLNDTLEAIEAKAKGENINPMEYDTVIKEVLNMIKNNPKAFEN